MKFVPARIDCGMNCLGAFLIAELAYGTRVGPSGSYQGSGAAKELVLIPIMLGFYILPTLLAWLRRHPRRWTITLINLLLGWTGVAWVIAMVMNFALTPTPDELD